MEQAQGQTAYDITTYSDLIQTDAAINPGNLVERLVDERGRLVGIKKMIQSPSGGIGAGSVMGIGFCDTGSTLAIDIANQLISTGKATHPTSAFPTQTVDENVAAVRLAVSSGVRSFPCRRGARRQGRASCVETSSPRSREPR